MLLPPVLRRRRRGILPATLLIFDVFRHHFARFHAMVERREVTMLQMSPTKNSAAARAGIGHRRAARGDGDATAGVRSLGKGKRVQKTSRVTDWRRASRRRLRLMSRKNTRN